MKRSIRCRGGAGGGCRVWARAPGTGEGAMTGPPGLPGPPFEGLPLGEPGHGSIEPALPDNAYILLDRSGRPVHVSPALEEVLPFRPAGMAGSGALLPVHPDDRDRCRAQWEQLLREPHQEVAAEFRLVDGQGGWRVVEAVGTNLLDHEAVGLVVVHLRDVTRQRAEEAAVRRSEQQLRLVIEHTTDVLVVVDHEGRAAWVSPSVTDLLGYRPEELVGARVLDYVHPTTWRPPSRHCSGRSPDRPGASRSSCGCARPMAPGYGWSRCHARSLAALPGPPRCSACATPRPASRPAVPCTRASDASAPWSSTATTWSPWSVPTPPSAGPPRTSLACSAGLPRSSSAATGSTWCTRTTSGTWSRSSSASWAASACPTPRRSCCGARTGPGCGSRSSAPTCSPIPTSPGSSSACATSVPAWRRNRTANGSWRSAT